MKLAIIRGDFLAPVEVSSFSLLADRNEVTFFTGMWPVWPHFAKASTGQVSFEKLFSPVDLNFGNISKVSMAILNRAFTDAHVLFGLEEKLIGFDIAHTAETYYSYTQQCINAKEKGYLKKIVSTVWENIPFNNEGIRGRKEFKQRAFKGVDLFLAVTNRAKEVLIEEGCDEKKIQVLYPGVGLSIFKKTRDPIASLQDDKRVRIIFSGRLVPEKGILEILEIFQRLQKKIGNVELVVAGEGPLNDELRVRSEELSVGSVHILGKVAYEKMPELYSSGDIFVHYPVGSNTWQEQFGMVLVEAMACGLAVVALDKGSVKEIVGDAGVVCCKENFEKDLSNLVKSKNLQKRLGEYALVRARKMFDMRKQMQKLENIYSDLL